MQLRLAVQFPYWEELHACDNLVEEFSGIRYSSYACSLTCSLPTLCVPDRLLRMQEFMSPSGRIVNVNHFYREDRILTPQSLPSMAAR